MPSTTNDNILEADASSKGLDGGLNAKTDPQRLAPPATTRADNAWYISPGAVDQLPAFASAMPAGFMHIYNLAAKDTLSPTLAGDTMVHGELPDPVGPFTTPVWAQSATAWRPHARSPPCRISCARAPSHRPCRGRIPPLSRPPGHP